MLEEVVDSLIVEERLLRRLVMRKGVEPNKRVVGFELVLVVDANSVVVVDPVDVVVDSTVFKRCGVIEEYISSTRYGVDPWLFSRVYQNVKKLSESLCLLIYIGPIYMQPISAKKMIFGAFS